MLSIEELKSILELYTYKDGWALSVEETRWHGPRLRIEVEVENSYQPGSKVSLGIDSLIPPMHTREQFAEWLQWRLIQAEVHECREFFRHVADGTPVFDPHGEDG